MGLFSLFKNNGSNGAPAGNMSFDQKVEKPAYDIPRELFIEESEPQPLRNTTGAGGVNGIEDIYTFLQADYENRGYNDALTNPDDSYRTDNINLIRWDLQILIQKVTTYYEDMIRELDFHISSRTRAGLIDLVEELQSRKEMVLEHKQKVHSLQQEHDNNTGMTQRIVLSYQRGFMRGLSALTQSRILNKKL